MKQIINKTLQSDQAGKNETKVPPKVVQVARASRHGGGDAQRAKVQSDGVGPSSITCRLLDKDLEETGSDITVYPGAHFGSNDLDGDVWPEVAANDVFNIVKIHGKWYTDFGFDDMTVC